MKNLDENIIKNTKFIFNPCLEFTMAFTTISKLNELKKLAEDLNYSISEENISLYDEMYNSLSKYMKSEIEYFNKICMIGGILAAYSADFEDVENVKSLLDVIDKSDETLFLNYLGGMYINAHEPTNHEGWDEVKNDIKKMQEYIEGVKVEDDEIKESVSELFKNPDETKNRISFLFRSFYEKIYIKYEKKVEEICLGGIDKYKKIFLDNPKDFMEKYLLDFFKTKDEDWQYKINFHISFFKELYFWIINMHDYKQKAGWVVLGINTDKIVEKKRQNEQVDNFLKALSDPRRVKIIKLLAKKPHYGYEIASILELTPATVNHHMNFLFDADIVGFNKIDNKVYFTLKKDKVRELLRLTEEILLGDSTIL
ncbi:ArsR/SmtB family transcription factor [Caloramator proteoclasticus]|uniref:DNA-binding transcriptional regulator, ArsR family n=1 Tax=Caloramator proteoclasticus DSM 10124 TaxID=1121262 RepID=A0A1M5A155_9CLOT|nr:metalloregulator ArsR/SmtB family transcription factor [Caloramator proteoclasticus]SHF24029.1 DNA-binding transcriptional regulator, ArsR family [Caloramator proteoclasticus DSM 10124]